MGKRYKISEVGALLGLSPSTIRFYEKKGLLQPKKDPANGYRYFEESDIVRLRSILFHRHISMSLTNIRNLKHAESLPAMRAIIEGQKAAALEKIREEEKNLRIYAFYQRIIDLTIEHLGALTVAETEPLHLFPFQQIYDTGASVFSFCHPLAVFGREGDAIVENGFFAAVHDREIKLLEPEDLAKRLKILPPFRAVYTVVAGEEYGEEMRLLEQAVMEAERRGYRVKAPFYIVYLATSCEWKDMRRYYEVYLSLEESE